MPTPAKAFALMALWGLLSPRGFSQPQHEHSLVTSGTQKQLPGSVNGAVTPASIPDTVAYRLFLKVLLNTPGSVEEAAARQRAILRSAKLSDQDFEEVKYAVQSFGKALARHYQAEADAALKPGGIDEGTATFLAQQREQITDDAKKDLETHLSPDGMARLHTLIMAEKANMTAIVGPVMPASGATK